MKQNTEKKQYACILLERYTSLINVSATDCKENLQQIRSFRIESLYLRLVVANNPCKFCRIKQKSALLPPLSRSSNTTNNENQMKFQFIIVTVITQAFKEVLALMSLKNL